jgi:2-oxoglutarate dehydrogenase E1 component
MKVKEQSIHLPEWKDHKITWRHMYVADCTTPANFFSLVEKTKWNNFPQTACCALHRLLRDLETFLLSRRFYSRTFQETIDDQTVNKADVKKHLFSAGKFYYIITAERDMLVEMKDILQDISNADDYV